MSKWQSDLQDLQSITGFEFYRDLKARHGEVFKYGRHGLSIEVKKHEPQEGPATFSAEMRIDFESSIGEAETAADVARDIGGKARMALSRMAVSVGLDVFPSRSVIERDPEIPRLIGVALTEQDAKIVMRYLAITTRYIDRPRTGDVRRAAAVIQAIDGALKSR